MDAEILELICQKSENEAGDLSDGGDPHSSKTASPSKVATATAVMMTQTSIINEIAV